jgi:hypothetical protein
MNEYMRMNCVCKNTRVCARATKLSALVVAAGIDGWRACGVRSCVSVWR